LIRGIELQLARSRHKKDTIRENIRAHILSSDGYIADISTHSPNIMMELGWIYFEPAFEGRLMMILRSDQGLLSPAWSPDGGRMAYTAQGPDGWRLEERDLRTGRIRIVGAQSPLHVTPSYAPGGDRLAFGMWLGTGTELHDYDVVRYCCMRRLSRRPRIDMYPTFSPDGSERIPSC